MRIVCVICTELFVINSHISVVNCGHVFHEECLFRWLKSGQQSCPQCRHKTSEKQIVKRLFLNESCDSTLDCSQLASSDDNSVPKEKYLSLLNKLEECKNDLNEQKTTVRTKSDLIEKKDNNIKELTTKVTTLTRNVADNRLLIEHLKRDLDTTERLRDINKKNVDTINDLNLKLREFRSVEAIYRDHDSQFNIEMKKYLDEKTTSAGNLTTIVSQLVRLNVLLKEHADKQQEEKRDIRKRYMQLEKSQQDRDKLIAKKASEVKTLHEQLESQHEKLKQKDAEYEKLRAKYISLSKMCKIQSIRVNNLEKEKELSPSKRLTSIFDNSAEKSNENSLNKEVKAEAIVNDTLSPKSDPANYVTPTTAASASTYVVHKISNANSRHEDSDLAFLPDVDILEFKCSKKKADESVEVIARLSTSATKRKEKENELSTNETSEAIQFSPMPKRRKNPFSKPDHDDSDVRILEIDEQPARKQLTLSQRVLADDVVPIARPITNKRFNALSENVVQPKQDTKKSVDVAYAFDGLGGRSKMYRMASTPINSHIKSSTPKLQAQQFAPLPMIMKNNPTSNGMQKHKSSNLIKYKVASASNILN